MDLEKTQTIENEALKVRGPDEMDCLMQLAHIHKLRDSEIGYEKNQHNLSVNILKNREGIAAPLIMAMELHEARKVGRMPFLRSSNLMEDVLLNRDEVITFSDFLGIPEYDEVLRQPHMLMDKINEIN